MMENNEYYEKWLIMDIIHPVIAKMMGNDDGTWGLDQQESELNII